MGNAPWQVGSSRSRGQRSSWLSWYCPIIVSLLLSFTDFGLSNLQNPFHLHFIGLQNYVHLAHDQIFLLAALNTLIIVVIGVPLNIGLALMIAIGLNRGTNYVRAIFRIGYYLPVVTSIVAIAVLWRYFFNPDVGLVNNLLHLVGITGPNWLNSPNWALPSIIFIVIWHNVGSSMIILLAGFLGIDPALYEAAKMDGAGKFALFRNVTFADAATYAASCHSADQRWLSASLSGTICVDTRWAAKPHAHRGHIPVPTRLRFLQPGICKCHGVCFVCGHRDTGIHSVSSFTTTDLIGRRVHNVANHYPRATYTYNGNQSD